MKNTVFLQRHVRSILSTSIQSEVLWSQHLAAIRVTVSQGTSVPASTVPAVVGAASVEPVLPGSLRRESRPERKYSKDVDTVALCLHSYLRHIHIQHPSR